jgi:SH3 domain-containing YSC84-like protein 1
VSKIISVFAVLCLSAALSAFAQSKIDKRLSESTSVLATLLDKPGGISKSVLSKARCVMVCPKEVKVAVGIGASSGHCVLVCRSGSAMNGNWGAPMMYTLDTGSLGGQFGSGSSDYVLLVMSERGENKVLSGELKLGADATAAAGPPSNEAVGFNDPNIDILTYSQSNGLFAGASLGSASIAPDNYANQQLYGKPIDAKEVMSRDVAVPAAGKPLVYLLNKNSPKAQ